jgi:solute carrier family 35 protein E1
MSLTPTSKMVESSSTMIENASQSSMSMMMNRFSSDPLLIGSTMIVSSAIFTTYYTTAFLKHKPQLKPTAFPSNVNVKHPSTSSLQLPFTHADMNTDRTTNINNNSNHKYSVLGAPTSKSKQMSKHGHTKKSNNPTFVTNILTSISRPQLLVLTRFGGSVLLGTFLHPNLHFIDRILTTVRAMSDFALPALFLFVANYCNSIALSRIGISLTYTSKCAIPLITVIFSYLLDGYSALPSLRTLLTLIPIAGGIAMASWNSPTFETLGFLAAMASTISQTALNVTSKRVMGKTGVTGLEAQRAMASCAFLISFIMLLWTNSYQYIKRSSTTTTDHLKNNQFVDVNSKPIITTTEELPPIHLFLGAICSYHMEYVLSFMFVRLVQPITYGTCDAIRRLCLIISGRVMFGGEAFSKLNITGIGVAILGALAYSYSSAMT